MKRFKYNNAIHKIALSAIVASLAGVVACDDVYWDREAYDGFIDTFGVKHPSQFDLNNNVCAYIARESMGIKSNDQSEWLGQIKAFHDDNPSVEIAQACLDLIGSNDMTLTPGGDSNSNGDSNKEIDPRFIECLRAQIDITQSRCDAVSVSDESEAGTLYIQIAEDITSADDLKPFNCPKNDKNKDKNICSDTSIEQKYRNILNYRQCPNGYSLIVTDGAKRKYYCSRTVCNSVAVHLETDMLNCGYCGNACDATENCTGGGCVPAECPEEQIRCNGKCIDPLTDPKYCGADTLCVEYTDCTKKSVDKLCVGGTCASSCPTDQPNICGEVCLNFSALNIDRCDNGKVLCKENYENVDGQVNTGCEVNLKTDNNHCGQKNNVCTNGRTCQNGTCLCPENYIYCNDKCIDPMTDPKYCSAELTCDHLIDCTQSAVNKLCVNGSCSSSCPSGQSICGNYCVDFAKLNIKGCSNGTITCESNFADIDKNVENGCEVNLMTDSNHCGATDNKCTYPQTCQNGACTCPHDQPDVCGSVCLNFDVVNVESCDNGTIKKCKDGYADVDININNGCEVNLNTDNYHCGKENNKCTNGRTCQNKVCKCPTDYAYCDDKCVDPKTDPKYCGKNTSCESLTDCTSNSVDKLCISGACASSCPTDQPNVCGSFCLNFGAVNIKNCAGSVIECEINFSDEDKSIENGCEVNLLTDNKYCGKDKIECTNGRTCQAGNCLCPTGLVYCNNKCIDPVTDPYYCGVDAECNNGKNCTSNAVNKLCSDRKCTSSCPSDQPNICGSYCVNFEKLNIDNCADGKIKCKSGYADVDKNINNGCEVDLSTDNKNCGGIGVACNYPQTCRGSNCECPESQPNVCGAACLNFVDLNIANCNEDVIKCKDDYGNFDNSINNGCEVNLKKDSNHCGRKDVVCKDGYCEDGVCKISKCNDPKQLPCGTNGACVDVTNDSSHCGTCNNPCGNNKYCVNRSCVQCINNTHCSGGLICNQDTHTCVECDSANACKDSNKRVCNLVSKTCVQCNAQSDCNSVTLSQAKSKYCDAGTGMCKIASCNDGYHLKNDTCILDTADQCGPSEIKCAIPHASGHVCLSGNCVATSCEPGYHLGVKAGSNALVCVDDTTTACGATTNDCTKMISGNITQVECNNGICEVKACKNGSHVTTDKRSCAKDTYLTCGPNDLNCSEEIKNSKSTRCTDGQCFATECDVNYHLSADNKSCVEDSPNACGYPTMNCNDLRKPDSNVEAVACNAGNCEVKSCTGDNHVSADKKKCEEDTIKACGPQIDDCSKLISGNVDEAICQGGECKVSKCKEGYDVNGDQTECVKKEPSGTDPGNGGDGSGSGFEGTGTGADGGTGGTDTGDNGGTESP